MELDLDKLSAVRVLGRGAMGTVFLVTDRSAHPSRPPVFALKVVEKHSPTAKPDADRRARWELSVLSRLRPHPFLPSLLGSLETPELLAWAVPFCPGGDLNALRYSLSDRIFSPAAIRFYLSEIVSALAHLHSLGIVYRDLKPENVLLQASGHVTLTDFDLSRHLAPQPPPPPPPPPPPLASIPSPSLPHPTTTIDVDAATTTTAATSPASSSAAMPAPVADPPTSPATSSSSSRRPSPPASPPSAAAAPAYPAWSPPASAPTPSSAPRSTSPPRSSVATATSSPSTGGPSASSPTR